jgi:protocatechuate 3,4-dioxygenase beta subunit
LLLGPFYPLDGAPRAGAAVCELACGEMNAGLHICGRVLNLAGEPVGGAWIEIWQADAAGHYRHPTAPETTPLDPLFRGFAAMRTDAAGRYEFRTVRPGPYGEGMLRRAPHVHFQVTGTHERLVTQMFFAGESLNDVDRWYRAVQRRESLLATPLAGIPPGTKVRFDIVLARG